MQKNSGGFLGVLLQEAPSSHLISSFKRGRIAQSYIFAGQESSGRMAVAKAFASLLQCQSPIINGGIVNPCGQCESCRRISAGSHPDVTEVVPGGSEITIEQIRRLQELAALKPSYGRWSIFIIDPADKLNLSSANCLLKTLEDSCESAVFILIASETSAVLPTILSRCEIVRFASPSPEQIRLELVKQGLDEAKAAVICSLSEGRFGRALSMAGGSVPFEASVGLHFSHTNYLLAFERASDCWQEEFSHADSFDKAIELLRGLCKHSALGIICARKEFCRSLALSAALPVSFASIYSSWLIDCLDKASIGIKKSLSSVITEGKKSYPAPVVKEFEASAAALLSAWVNQELENLFLCLQNLYSDALKISFGANENILLNLNLKKDIIKLSKAESACLLKARIALCEESVMLLKRYIQPVLIVENLITQIGGF